MKNKPGRLLVLLLLMSNTVFSKQDLNQSKAKFNYQMLCQGCHTGNGLGNKSVPKLKDFIGYFVHSQQGREYLVRVPGSANSVLNDKDLAEVLNWMLGRFAGDSLPINWNYYQAEEVARYRSQPLFETVKYRKKLIESLSIE